jgi:predicted amidohydrolase YtcJ
MAAQMEIFKARRVISLAEVEAEPEAFAVLGERIVGTGSVEELRGRFPEATVTDVGDGVIVPGFNDSHMHPSSVAIDLLNLDVSSDAVKSLREITGKVLDQAKRTEPGPGSRRRGTTTARWPRAGC